MARKKKKKTDSAPAVETAPAERPAPPARKGSPLVTVLTVLLILVGIADLFLWGLAGYYLLQGSQTPSGGGTVQSAPAGGASAQSAPAAAGTSPQSTPAGGAASPAPPTPGGGGDDAADREALEAYIQSLSTAFQLDNQMQESYQSVAGTNYTDDETTYTEITERTLPLCQHLNEAVLAITPSDPEISQLHGIFRDYVTKYVNALSMLTSAIADQDTSQVTQANDLINEASDLVVSYHQTLQTLASQRGVTLNN